MNLSRLIVKRVVQGWKEYNLARDDAQLEYHKEMARVLEEMSDQGHAELRRLKGGVI